MKYNNLIRDVAEKNPEFTKSVKRIQEAYAGKGFYGFVDDFTLAAVEPEDIVKQEAEILLSKYPKKDELNQRQILPEIERYLKEVAEVIYPKPLKDPKFIKIRL